EVLVAGSLWRRLCVRRDPSRIRCAGVERSESSREGIRIFRCEIDDVIVGIARALPHSGRMPADQQRLDVLLDIKIGEFLFCPGDVVEISSEIMAGLRVEPVGARMNVNVNGPHDGSLSYA